MTSPVSSRATATTWLRVLARSAPSGPPPPLAAQVLTASMSWRPPGSLAVVLAIAETTWMARLRFGNQPL